MIHQYIVENFYDYTFTILYILNLILLIIAYKLGFARKIPLLKSLFVYILLAIGNVMITLFNGIAELPTIESLIVINLILGIYRLRLHNERKVKKTE